MKSSLIFAAALFGALALSFYVTSQSITHKSGKYDYLESLAPIGKGFSGPIGSEEAAITAARDVCKAKTTIYGGDMAARILVNPLQAHKDGGAWVVEPADDSKRFLAALPASGQGMPLCQFTPHWDTPFTSQDPGARFHQHDSPFSIGRP